MIKKIILRNKIFFLLLTKKTKGMMGATKYYKLYNYANIAARTGSIIEIGAGSGSSTIALALGVKDINKAYTITTFEKCEGGSRCVYGDKADNNKMLIENFKFFNVSHNIYIKDMDYNDLTASELQSFSRLSLLFSDADGEIGRQFKLFYNKILPGGYIIIDDYSYKKNKNY